MSTLYAWVKPAFIQGFLWDHTWVTNYDNRVQSYPDINSVVAAGGSNWYCWGDFHQQGGTSGIPDGFIGSAAGATSYARCLCTDNSPSNADPSACGTIFKYGLHGVCHQLANQVLWATGGYGSSPLTVHLAQGYGVSSAFYGDYGTTAAAWQRKMTQCRVPVPQALNGAISFIGRRKESMMERLVDSFERNARSVLKDTPQASKVEKLLKLRRAHQERLLQIDADIETGKRQYPSAQELNEMNNTFLLQAEELLGAIHFQKIFGIPAGQVVNLIHQETLDAIHHE